MGKKKTRPRKASGDDARKQAVKPVLEGAAAVEGDTPHLRTTTSAGTEDVLPQEGKYTLNYRWNGGKATPMEGSSQLAFSWTGRTGTIEGGDSPVAIDYKGITSESAADGETVKFYQFEEAEEPGSDKSPDVWALEIKPRTYKTSSGLQELCTVGRYTAGGPTMEIEGLATRNK